MKKTYQDPTTVIVLLSTGAILTNSNGILGNGQTPKSFDPTKEVNTTDATSGNLSRRRSEWDDEEEEDF